MAALDALVRNGIQATTESIGRAVVQHVASPTITSHNAEALVDNEGEDAHNMVMEKVGPHDEPEGEPFKVSSYTEAGTQTTKSVEVEVGTYRMWCSFENGRHAAEGMETHITVTP